MLPAGVPNTLRTASDSLVLPVGYRTGSDEAPGTLVSPAHFPAGEYWSLVRASVARYTAVPTRADDAAAYERVRTAAQNGEATSDQRLLGALASIVTRADDGHHRSLDQWADLLRVSPDRLRGCVHREAGVGFAQWLRLSRMSRARLQLLRGAPVGNVARQLGYAHLPAFTRAFRAVYGTPPRECRSAS
ncbi:helix-turn-helix transcriptional regulator [Gordonia iterans]